MDIGANVVHGMPFPIHRSLRRKNLRFSDHKGSQVIRKHYCLWVSVNAEVDGRPYREMARLLSRNNNHRLTGTINMDVA